MAAFTAYRKVHPNLSLAPHPSFPERFVHHQTNQKLTDRLDENDPILLCIHIGGNARCRVISFLDYSSVWERCVKARGVLPIHEPNENFSYQREVGSAKIFHRNQSRVAQGPHNLREILRKKSGCVI